MSCDVNLRLMSGCDRLEAGINDGNDLASQDN